MLILKARRDRKLFLRVFFRKFYEKLYKKISLFGIIKINSTKLPKITLEYFVRERLKRVFARKISLINKRR